MRPPCEHYARQSRTEHELLMTARRHGADGDMSGKIYWIGGGSTTNRTERAPVQRTTQNLFTPLIVKCLRISSENLVDPGNTSQRHLPHHRAPYQTAILHNRNLFGKRRREILSDLATSPPPRAGACPGSRKSVPAITYGIRGCLPAPGHR